MGCTQRSKDFTPRKRSKKSDAQKKKDDQARAFFCHHMLQNEEEMRDAKSLMLLAIEKMRTRFIGQQQCSALTVAMFIFRRHFAPSLSNVPQE